MGPWDSIHETIGSWLVWIGAGTTLIAVVRYFRDRPADRDRPLWRLPYGTRRDLLRKVRRDQVEPVDDLALLRRTAELMARQETLAYSQAGLIVLWVGIMLNPFDPWLYWIGIPKVAVLAVLSGLMVRNVRVGRAFLRRHPVADRSHPASSWDGSHEERAPS